MDAGPILDQTSTPLNGSETSPELLDELFEKGTRRLIDLLPKVLSGEVKQSDSAVQDENSATKASKIEPAEAHVRIPPRQQRITMYTGTV